MANERSEALVPPESREVFESMLALRKASGQAKSLADWRRDGRYATPEEIAVSEAMRKPTDCVGHSARTGLACANSRLQSMTCCARHGGNLKRVKAKAAQRLQEATMPVLNNMIHVASQKENLTAAVKAGSDLLDRAGIGEMVQAKVRSSQKSEGDRIQVTIGFLQLPGGQGAVIEVPAKPVGHQE